MFSDTQRWTLLGLFALLVIFRLPHAWVHGRFQDEEATVFLAYAWHHSWFDALFRPFAGYWNFGANATTVLIAQLVQGGILPLERAPYMTMGVALVVQLIPAILILTGKANWLAGRLAVITALLIIAITPATEEVFFNVLHIQFHLALSAALILALDVPSRRIEHIGYGILLFVAPLCGPGAIILIPWFALRGLIERDPARLMQLGALAAGAAVQLLLFFGSSIVRGHPVDPATLAASMFVRLVALPLLGPSVANSAAGFISSSMIAGDTRWWWFAAAGAALFVAFSVLAARRRDGAIWLVLSGLSIAVASLGFGMVLLRRVTLFSVFAGERYNFLPVVLLGLALVMLAMRPGFRGKTSCASLCALMLLTDAYHYLKPLQDFADGPSWPAEVLAWRSNHNHALAVWPSPWRADLSDRTRPCSPPSRDVTRSSDPRYCESGWIAGMYKGM